MTTRVPSALLGSVSPSGGDDTAALAAALAAYDVVDLAAGNYSFSSLPALVGKTLRGAGVNQTVLTYTGAGNAITVQGLDSAASSVRDLRLVGNANATGGIVLGGGTGCRRAYLLNLYVTGFTKAGAFGVDLAAALGAGVYYNELHNVASYSNANGFRCYSSDGAANGNRANANTFVNCQAQSNTGDGWFFDYAVGNTVTGCDRELNGGYGVNSDHTLDLTLIGGYSENNTSGWLRKTANGSVRALGGRIVDQGTGSVTYATGDVFLHRSDQQAFVPSAGLGMGGSAVVTPAAGVATLPSPTFASVVEITLAANVTSVVFPPGQDGQVLKILWKQAAAGGPYTVAGFTGGANVRLLGGAFTMTATASKVDSQVFRWNQDNTCWFEESRAQNL